MKTAFQIITVVMTIVSAVELENATPGAGAEKKRLAVERIRAVLDPVLPDWVNPILGTLLPILIDAVVAYANRTGVFDSFAAG